MFGCELKEERKSKMCQMYITGPFYPKGRWTNVHNPCSKFKYLMYFCMCGGGGIPRAAQW